MTRIVHDQPALGAPGVERFWEAKGRGYVGGDGLPPLPRTPQGVLATENPYRSWQGGCANWLGWVLILELLRSG